MPKVKTANMGKMEQEEWMVLVVVMVATEELPLAQTKVVMDSLDLVVKMVLVALMAKVASKERTAAT